MRLRETKIAGAFLIEPEPVRDERGLFARTWDRDEFKRFGLDTDLSQCSVAFNEHRGTLRGLHFQSPSHAETKLVRCIRGAIYDVIVDIRRDSPAYRKWQAFELTDENRWQLYIPKGVAHGYVTLADQTEVSYQISTPYIAEAARGVRWDDPAFGIEWPLQPAVISARDSSFGDCHAAA